MGCSLSKVFYVFLFVSSCLSNSAFAQRDGDRSALSEGWVQAFSNGWQQMAKTHVQTTDFLDQPIMNEFTDNSSPFNWGSDLDISNSFIDWYYLEKDTAYETDDWNNGLSALDLVLITWHINRTQPFTTIREFIAADVNLDGVVNDDDLMDLQAQILLLTSELPQGEGRHNQPFMYVEEDAWDFAQQILDLDPDLLEQLNILHEIYAFAPYTAGNEDGVINAYAVKRGDVNGSWVPPSQTQGWVKAFSFGWQQMEDTHVQTTDFLDQPIMNELTDTSSPFNWSSDLDISDSFIDWYYLEKDYPYETKQHWNSGLSTLDLVLISRHLTGLQPFTTLREYIAADVNLDGVVNSFDLIDLQKQILFITTELPQGEGRHNQPFMYVEEDAYDFAQQIFDLSPDLLEQLNILHEIYAFAPYTGDNDDGVINAYAIKRGDVNGSWVPE